MVCWHACLCAEVLHAGQWHGSFPCRVSGCLCAVCAQQFCLRSCRIDDSFRRSRTSFCIAYPSPQYRVVLMGIRVRWGGLQAWSVPYASANAMLHKNHLLFGLAHNVMQTTSMGALCRTAHVVAVASPVSCVLAWGLFVVLTSVSAYVCVKYPYAHWPCTCVLPHTIWCICSMPAGHSAYLSSKLRLACCCAVGLNADASPVVAFEVRYHPFWLMTSLLSPRLAKARCDLLYS
jgi:hypothetical protein